MSTREKKVVTMLTDAQRLAFVHLVEVWSPISDRRSALTASYLRQIHGSIRSILSGARSARASVLSKVATRFAKWAADQDAESFAWAIPLTDEEAQALRAALETAGVLTVYEETYRAESLVLERRSRLAKQGLIPTFPRPSTSMALAPFLSSDGEAMLLALGACSGGEGLSLHLLTAVTGTKGWGYRLDEDGRTNRENVRSADVLGAICEHYNSLITEGIYYAPWQPHGHPEGGALVVVDRDWLRSSTTPTLIPMSAERTRTHRLCSTWLALATSRQTRCLARHQAATATRTTMATSSTWTTVARIGSSEPDAEQAETGATRQYCPVARAQLGGRGCHEGGRRPLNTGCRSL